ncbi:MAG: ketopantoate reductase family protein [Hyphomicrobiaceae bacterium]
MKVLCLGAGAIGGYYCGRLAQAGAADVTFLVRPQRKAKLAEDGLRIESPAGDATVRVNAVTRDEIDGPADIVILTCKAYDLDDAIQSIRPAVGPGTAILPLLNGISHVGRLQEEFGAGAVIGGVARIAITLMPNGLIKHLNDWTFITFGEVDGRISERVLALKAAFDRAPGVKATAVPDIMAQLWDKIVFLATMAGMTSLMRANAGEIARSEGGTALAHQLLAINAEIAARSGFPLPEATLTRYRSFYADTANPVAASMLRDIEGRQKTEGDHIIGFLLGEARRLGVDTGLLAIIHTHLRAYEERRAAGRL